MMKYDLEDEMLPKKYIFAITFLFVFVARSLFAGGPFVVDVVGNSGAAQQWPNNTLIWYVDDGDLSNTVNNATAKQWVAEAMAQWSGVKLQNASRSLVKTTGIKTTLAGSIGKNIDSTNYEEYLLTQEGPTVIIFDRDGLITKRFVFDDYLDVPGLSQLLLSTSDGKKILRGVVILNGLLLTNNRITQPQFKAAVLHEIGHLFNLDHTQVNLDVADACELGETCDDAEFIPTMFPGLRTAMQNELALDDKITLSWIYPNDTLNKDFCQITGEILDKDGNPMQGVNVIAKRVGDGDRITKDDSRSMVSGVMYDACINDGHYYLHGIVPGKSYEVIYEPLTPDYSTSDISGFEPINNPPTDFATANITDANGQTTVKCNSGGEIIEMQAVRVPVANPCPERKAIGEGASVSDEAGGSGSSSGGCQLVVK